jgi:hypothetical protein
MKIRLGFVANSSSSSFLIYGVCVELEYNEDENEEEDIHDEAYKAGLSLDRPWNDSYYIGIEFSSMEKDETRRQFEVSTEKKVNDFLDKIKYTGPRIFDVFKEAWT